MINKATDERQSDQLKINWLTTELAKEQDINKLVDLYLERAYCYEDLGESKCAVEDYLNALEIAEKFEERARIKTMIALAAARNGPKEQALYWSMSAVDEDSDNSENHYILGLVCDLCGFHNLAITALYKAIDLQPNHEAAMLNLGKYLRKKGRVEESINMLSQHIAQHPHDPNGLYEMGCSLLASVNSDKQREQSKQYFKQALKNSPSDHLQVMIERKLADLQ